MTDPRVVYTCEGRFQVEFVTLVLVIERNFQSTTFRFILLLEDYIYRRHLFLNVKYVKTIHAK